MTRIRQRYFLFFTLCFILLSCAVYKTYNSYRPIEEFDVMYSNVYYSCFTEAINSLISVSGKSIKEDSQPDLILIEKDNFGRILFFYTEPSYLNVQSYLIMQSFDDEYVFYYEDYNFKLLKDYKISNDTIEELKENNDWNKELKLAKCIKKKIIHERKISPSKEKIEEIINISYNEFHLENAIYMTENEKGISIIYVNGYINDENKDFIIIINKAYDYNVGCIMELSDSIKYNYQDALKEFKINNNWYINLDNNTNY